jgi:hypothetical protein
VNAKPRCAWRKNPAGKCPKKRDGLQDIRHSSAPTNYRRQNYTSL